ncbi:MAG: hypothetical protein NTZ05_07525, partial [Chloroflexi bacterium]|nr:hypothetical protein [Chloroflexota bacterium]
MGRWWIIPAIVALAAGLFPLAAEPASPASDGPYRPLAGDTTATPTASPFPTITPTVTPFPTVTPWATPEATATAAPTVNPRFPLVPGPAAPANGGTLPALGAVLLRWNLPSGAAQYQVQLLPANSDGPGINLIRNAAGSYTIPAPLLGQGPYILLPGTRYLWRVRASGSAASIAESDASWGRWSDFWTFRTARPSLTGLTASAPADGGVVDQQPVALVWGNRETSVFYYEIQVSRDSQFRTAGNAVASVWWNLVHGGAAEPLNSWRAPTLDAAATYYWRVRPRVQGGEPATEWGPTWRFSTAAGLPAPTATPPPTATPRPLGSPTPTATPVPQPHIAFISNRDGNTELYVMNTDGSGQTRLTANLGAEDTLPAWSPNGRYIAFSSGGSISVAAVDGSDTRSLANGGSRPAWSPDGLHIAFINSG